MAAKPLVVLSMAGAITVADARRAYPQDTRNHKPPHDMSVIVRLDNDARVPAPILRFAKESATGIYRWIGVNVVWIDVEDAIRQKIRPSYTVVLLTPEGENRRVLSEGVPDDAIGQAVPAARRAHVFYERVTAKVQLPHRDIVTLLGYAMAHELGHLLLPPNSHSTEGIMGPNFDTGPRVIPSFTKAQATAIRERLRSDAQSTHVVPD